MKISFRSKHEAAGGAGEEQEYAQIWERKVGTARRCLGKGTAADKLVLDCALEQVLETGEREPEIPMEYEENEPHEEQEKIKISMESMENFNNFGNNQKFNVETTLTY